MARALATIERIAAIEEHPDADRLEIARVRGWQCVVRKADEFRPGQDVLYLEVDSHLDVADERFAFLAKGGMRTAADGWKGHRLKTVKLRGQISQGLVLPLDQFPELMSAMERGIADVTDLLPIRLWEPPIPYSAEIVGPFPDSIPKTDEERVQNLSPDDLAMAMRWDHLEIREKIDGQSVTAWTRLDGSVGIAGRNFELSPESTAARTVMESAAGKFLAGYGPGLFFQGELCGPSIQGNPLKLTAPRWFLFSMGFTDGREYRRVDMAQFLPDDILFGETAPRIPPGMITSKATVDELVAFANGINSMVNPEAAAEGIVVRGYDDIGNLQSSYKVINNEYLLSTSD